MGPPAGSAEKGCGAVPGSEFAAIDEQRFKSFRWLATLTTGLGVFCDGYDLSSVALVLPPILASFGQKSLTGVESGALAASAFVGAMIGALVFGVLGHHGIRGGVELSGALAVG